VVHDGIIAIIIINQGTVLMPMGAQVFASEAVTCPALLLSCLAGLQLPLACLLLIINSVLLYAMLAIRFACAALEPEP
jgi:hypothetical protein